MENPSVTHSIAVRFAEKILTGKGFTVTTNTDCDLLIDNSVKVSVLSSKIEANRESYGFHPSKKHCDVAMCVGIGEKVFNRQQVVTYIMTPYDIGNLRSLRIPVSGRSQYACFLNRFDLIKKMATRKRAVG